MPPDPPPPAPALVEPATPLTPLPPLAPPPKQNICMNLALRGFSHVCQAVAP
jgi:hypothetical protein